MNIELSWTSPQLLSENVWTELRKVNLKLTSCGLKPASRTSHFCKSSWWIRTHFLFIFFLQYFFSPKMGIGSWGRFAPAMRQRFENVIERNPVALPLVFHFWRTELTRAIEYLQRVLDGSLRTLVHKEFLSVFRNVAFRHGRCLQREKNVTFYNGVNSILLLDQKIYRYNHKREQKWRNQQSAIKALGLLGAGRGRIVKYQGAETTGRTGC